MLERWTAAVQKFAQRHAWPVLAAAVCVAAAMWPLGVRDLRWDGMAGVFDPGELWVQRAAAWSAMDPMTRVAGEVVVLVDEGPDGERRGAAEGAARALAEGLTADGRVGAAVGGIDLHTVSPKLLLTLPTDRVRRALAGLAEAEAVLAEATASGMIGRVLRGAVAAGIAGDSDNGDASAGGGIVAGAAAFAGLMAAVEGRLETGEPADVLAGAERAMGVERWQPLRTASGRLLVVRVALVAGREAESLEVVRSYAASAAERFGVEAGVTGEPAVVAEALPLLHDVAVRAAWGGAAAVLLLGGFLWRSWRLPLAVALTAGWTGWITLGLIAACWGGLHVVSGAAAGAVLLVQTWAALAVAGGFARRGRVEPSVGIAAGAVAVAAVGCGLILPGNPGLRDAGVVLVMGSGSALLGGLAVGSACLAVLCRGWNVDGRVAQRGGGVQALVRWSRRRPTAMMVLAGAVTLGLVSVLPWSRWAGDPARFLPRDAASVRWLERVVEEGGEVPLHAVSVAADIGGVRRRVAAFGALPGVGRVGGFGRLVLDDEAEKRAAVAALREAVGPHLAQAAGPGSAEDGRLMDTLSAVRVVAGGLAASAKGAEAEALQRVAASAEAVLAAAERLAEPVRAERLAGVQAEYAAARQRLAGVLGELTDPSPLGLGDVRGAWDVFGAWAVGAGVRPGLIVKLYPRAPAARRAKEPGEHGERGAGGAWPAWHDVKALVRAARRVDPAVTGRLVTYYDRRVAMTRAGWIAGAGAALMLVLAGGVTAWRWWGGLPLIASATVGGLAMLATLTLMGDAWSAAAWVGWSVIAVVGVGAAASVSGRTGAFDNRHRTGMAIDDDPRVVVERDAAAEAFGLIVASAFIAAAATRAVDAPALTALAVAVPVGLLASGLIGLVTTTAAAAWAASPRPAAREKTPEAPPRSRPPAPHR